jgi:hypothetical protein
VRTKPIRHPSQFTTTSLVGAAGWLSWSSRRCAARRAQRTQQATTKDESWTATAFALAHLPPLNEGPKIEEKEFLIAVKIRKMGLMVNVIFELLLWRLLLL